MLPHGGVSGAIVVVVVDVVAAAVISYHMNAAI